MASKQQQKHPLILEASKRLDLSDKDTWRRLSKNKIVSTGKEKTHSCATDNI